MSNIDDIYFNYNFDLNRDKLTKVIFEVRSMSFYGEIPRLYDVLKNLLDGQSSGIRDFFMYDYESESVIFDYSKLAHLYFISHLYVKAIPKKDLRGGYMTLKQAEKIKSCDKKDYVLNNNQDFLNLLNKNGNSLNLFFYQGIIDKITKGYEEIYPNHAFYFNKDNFGFDLGDDFRFPLDKFISNSFDATETFFMYNHTDAIFNFILNKIILKIFYSDKTIPEIGYERALCFIRDFNKFYSLNLNSDEIDEVMNEYVSKDKVLRK